MGHFEVKKCNVGYFGGGVQYKGGPRLFWGGWVGAVEQCPQYGILGGGVLTECRGGFWGEGGSFGVLGVGFDGHRLERDLIGGGGWVGGGLRWGGAHWGGGVTGTLPQLFSSPPPPNSHAAVQWKFPLSP